MQAASRVLGVLKSFQLSWDVPAAGTLTLTVDPVSGLADSGILQRDLTDLLRAVAEHAAERDKGVVLTIDEIQNLPKEHLRSLVIALHEISQVDLPLLVAGAGLPSILGLLGEARTYAERLFGFVEINSLDEEAAVRALAKPASAEGVTWDDAALEETLQRTAGYPYFLQEFGRQVWRMAEGPDRIIRQDVLDAAPVAIAELDAGFFRVRMDRTTDAQRAYLSAMAAMGSRPPPLGGHRQGAGAQDDPTCTGAPELSSPAVSAIPPATTCSPSPCPCSTSSSAATSTRSRRGRWRAGTRWSRRAPETREISIAGKSWRE